MEYAKPWLTLDQQAGLLIERGMQADRDRLFALLLTRSEDELARMGFSDGWRDCPIWTRWLPDEDAGDARTDG